MNEHREGGNPLVEAVRRVDGLAQELGADVSTEMKKWTLAKDRVRLTLEFDMNGDVKTYALDRDGELIESQDRVDWRWAEDRFRRALAGELTPLEGSGSVGQGLDVDSAPTVIDNDLTRTELNLEPKAARHGDDREDLAA